MTRSSAMTGTSTAFEALTPDDAVARDERDDATRATRKFAWLLFGIVVLGCVIQVTNALVFTRYRLAGDAYYFHHQAQAIADGHGFVQPNLFVTRHITRPGAAHPPAFPLFLALLDVVGIRSVDAQRVVASVFGCGTIAVIGILGRRIGGSTVGLVAAGLAAVCPTLWIADAQLLSEGLYGFALASTLLLSYRYWDSPTVRRAVAVAAAVALAALTRGEALLLYILLVVPLVWLRTRSEPTARRWRSLGAAASVAVVLIGPWVVYNADRFSTFAYSTNSGSVVMYANCSRTWDLTHPKMLGYWSPTCLRHNLQGSNEAEVDSSAMTAGLDYAAAHAKRFPIVALARLGRMVDLYNPSGTISFDAYFEGRGLWQSELAMTFFFASIAFAVPGVVLMRRRRQVVFPLFAMGSLALLSAVVTYANVRFRIPLDLALIVPAAVAVVAAVRFLRSDPVVPEPSTSPSPAS